MVQGNVEFLVAAFRDRAFGVIVGCGMGGDMTEIIDDVGLRAPTAADGAYDLLHTLRTVRLMPSLMSDIQAQNASSFIAGFSQPAASAPWPDFILEVNQLKLGIDSVSAVDGLLVIGP